MKDLVLIGCGDFGRETAALVRRINGNSIEPQFNLLGYIDDDSELQGRYVEGAPVIGDIGWFKNCKKPISTVCTISNYKTKKRVIERINNPNVEFATLIDPTVVFLSNYKIGEGSIICANTIISVDVEVGRHNIIDLACTLGHDDVTGDYCSIMPGCNISGKVHLKEGVFLGTGSKIIQGYTVGENVIIGAGAVVNKDIPANCTAVGIPAKPLFK